MKLGLIVFLIAFIVWILPVSLLDIALTSQNVPEPYMVCCSLTLFPALCLSFSPSPHPPSSSPPLSSFPSHPNRMKPFISNRPKFCALNLTLQILTFQFPLVPTSQLQLEPSFYLPFVTTSSTIALTGLISWTL